MYRIIKTDGTELGVSEKVNFIKIGASGSYATATRETAVGVAYKSTPYNLFGHDEIPGAETVIVSEFDGGERILELQEENKLLKAQTEALSTYQDFQDDLIAEMAMEVYK